MGCINSKKDLIDNNPNIFRVSNIDDYNTALWSGQLEISRTELTLYRKGKKPTQWPLQCLRRYGYDADLFSFEVGRRCTTGPGIYAFRCRRAENLFNTLQTYIQGRYSTDETINSGDPIFPMPSSTNGPSISIRNQSLSSRPNSGGGGSGGGVGSVHLGHNINSTGNNSIMYNRSGVTTSQSLSPNGTIHSNSNQSRSSDTLTADGNYLEPTPNRQQQLATRFTTGIRLSSVSGPLSPDLQSPGSPNSITNILEVTTLNPLPNSHHGVSNVYQEFPLRENNNNININNNNNNLNNNINKKLTLDIPHNINEQDKNNGISSQIASTSKMLPPMSPTTMTYQDNGQHSYMNVNLGESQILQNSITNQSTLSTVVTPSTITTISTSLSSTAANDLTTATTPTTTMSIINKTIVNNYDDSPNITTPTTSTSSSTIFGFNNRLSSYSNITNDTNRCYENLEPGDLRPLLMRNRYSKPDIFAKIDLPLEPTNTDRKVNYIVLDLDQSNLAMTTTNTIYSIINNGIAINNNNNINNINNNNNNNNNINNNVTTTPTNTTLTTTTTTTITSGSSIVTTSSSLLLPPESPKNASLGYATIDFNKTVALSNSTTRSSELDSEGSRKTRHNSLLL